MRPPEQAGRAADVSVASGREVPHRPRPRDPTPRSRTSTKPWATSSRRSVFSTHESARSRSGWPPRMCRSTARPGWPPPGSSGAGSTRWRSTSAPAHPAARWCMPTAGTVAWSAPFRRAAHPPMASSPGVRSPCVHLSTERMSRSARAAEVLATCNEGSLGGLVLSGVIDRLPLPGVIPLLAQARRALAPGAPLVVVSGGSDGPGARRTDHGRSGRWAVSPPPDVGPAPRAQRVRRRRVEASPPAAQVESDDQRFAVTATTPST